MALYVLTYLLTNAEQSLIYNIFFSLPKRIGRYFLIPGGAFTDTSQKMSQAQWEAEKNLEENFDTVCTTLTQISDRIINDAYHTDATSMGQQGFGSFTTKAILEKLLRMCGNPSLPEL